MSQMYLMLFLYFSDVSDVFDAFYISLYIFHVSDVFDVFFFFFQQIHTQFIPHIDTEQALQVHSPPPPQTNKQKTTINYQQNHFFQHVSIWILQNKYRTFSFVSYLKASHLLMII